MNRKLLLAKTFFTFFVNGLMALMLGSIMPFLISDYGIDYATAGLFISLHALGNLAASFVIVFLIGQIGRKRAVLLMAALLPLSYMAITVFRNIYILYFLFFLTGLSRGSISNTDNFIVNNVCVGRADMLNLLHTFFAIGGFISPLLCSFAVQNSIEWKIVVWIGIFFAVMGLIVYGLIDFREINAIKKSNGKEHYGNRIFYIGAFLLFFYMGVENSINGWVVTYFKDSGIMSTSNAQIMLSLTWLFIILGRLITGYLSEKKIEKRIVILICSAVSAVLCFILLRSTDSKIITVVISIFSFFIAGIYPTTVAALGKNIKSSDFAMGILMAIAGAGGIILPYIVGIIANLKGISAGMAVVSINTAIVVFMAFLFMFTGRINKKRKGRKKYKE